MYRPIIPLLAVALSCPAFAQISARPPAQPGHTMPSTAANQTHEASSPLSLQAALRLALQANPELRSAEHEVLAVEAATMQARALPNPTLEIGVEDTRRETRETTVQLSQPLELGGRRASRVSAAERAQDAARADLRVRRATVQADVITAFMNTVAAQERLRLSQESQDVADRVTTAVSKRVQAGKASPVEETRARVAQSYVRLEVSKAQSELNNARLALASTWKNLSPQFQHAIGTVSNLPELPSWEALAAKFSSLPAVVRARVEVARREALVAVEQSRRTPDVAITAGVKRSAELGRNQAVFGLSVPLPLFDRNRGNVLEALRRTDVAKDEFEAAETKTYNDLAQAYERLRVSRHEAQVLASEILPGAQSAYDAAVKGFEFGKFAYFDVLDAQRTLIQSKADYLRAFSESHRAAADITRITGVDMPNIEH